MYNRTNAGFGQCKFCKPCLNKVFKAVGRILSARLYHFNFLIILS